MPIDIKVAGRLGHFDDHSLHVLGNLNLAAQATCFRQPKGHIQHIFFIFGGFG